MSESGSTSASKCTPWLSNVSQFRRAAGEGALQVL